MEKQLTGLYGAPSAEYDMLRAGSIWNEPQDWMGGLSRKERTLDSYWIAPRSGEAHPVSLPNSLTAITLEAVGLSASKGYIRLVYEFEGFEASVDKRNAAESNVLK